MQALTAQASFPASPPRKWREFKVAFHESHPQLIDGDIEKPAQSMSDVIDVPTALMACAQTESDTIPT